MTCVRLLGGEVLPAVKEYAKEIGLTDPFELDTPVSLEQSATGSLQPAVAG
jgi:hypothetical protein